MLASHDCISSILHYVCMCIYIYIYVFNCIYLFIFIYFIYILSTGMQALRINCFHKLLILRGVFTRKNSAAPALLTCQPHCLHQSRKRQLPTELHSSADFALLQRPSVAFGRKGRPFQSQSHFFPIFPDIDKMWRTSMRSNQTVSLSQARPGLVCVSTESQEQLR